MEKMEEAIIQDYEKTTGETVKKWNTPGTPGKVLCKSEGAPVKIEAYRSIVGKALYYMTKVAPELANAVRELSSHMANPNDDHWKELGRLVGYLKHRPPAGLTFRRPTELRSISLSDSNYGTDPDTRRSISGRVSTLGGMITGWSSRKQATVTLSSTEAEYIALTECAQEMRMMNMLLQELFRKPQRGTIYEDNTGAIFLVRNQQVGSRTKHIDIRYHYLRDLNESGEMEVKFVRTDDNISDLMTKNLSEKLYDKHVSSIRDGSTLTRLREDVKRPESARRSDGQDSVKSPSVT